ncbi:protein of unknown function (plasmid) [Cupriavidus taiwanensis]|nr:protein of unknown function [Cupriavidus taiwanensis]
MSRSSSRIVVVMVSGLRIAASSLGQTESRQHASLGKGYVISIWLKCDITIWANTCCQS